MPSFADSIFLFVLALLLFGPKKLPVLARELGKWMGEFRRASNEFKMQMEDELRASEQAERKQQIAAMEAAAPVPPPSNEPPEPEHPHLRYTMPEPPPEPVDFAPAAPDRNEAPSPEPDPSTNPGAPSLAAVSSPVKMGLPDSTSPTTADGARPIPIATSGSLNMMPPATGLPTPRTPRVSALASLVDAIPEATTNGNGASSAPENVAHAD